VQIQERLGSPDERALVSGLRAFKSVL
jgi:hypothetical protein